MISGEKYKYKFNKDRDCFELEKRAVNKKLFSKFVRPDATIEMDHTSTIPK